MAAFERNKKHDFNLEKVLISFQKCVKDDKSLISEEYLLAYSELCRFFKLTGHLFGFVAKDLESKIKAIEYHMHSKHGHSYYTIQSMVAYELEAKISKMKTPRSSGTRMLLRLHHALEFILSFMRRIMKGDQNEKMSVLAWEVYAETLIHHHPWYTQKIASLAVHALPSKRHLIEVMCKHDYTKVMALLGHVVEAGQPVYDIIQEILATNELLNIP